MNKFAKALLLALIFAAPVTVASQAQAKTIHHTSGKYAKVHHTKHHRRHAKKIHKHL
ncbi:MAG: hypothetical protein V7K41_23255 [Nostoc sp.]|uniref:hypothetical protein n=1 Tax=Nostoc sp. TaxID=1180 RepID=UPI002FF83B3E